MALSLVLHGLVTLVCSVIADFAVTSRSHAVRARQLLAAGGAQGNEGELRVIIAGRDDRWVSVGSETTIAKVIRDATGACPADFEARYFGEIVPATKRLSDTGIGSEAAIYLEPIVDDLTLVWESLRDNDVRIRNKMLGFTDFCKFRDHYTGRVVDRTLCVFRMKLNANGAVESLIWTGIPGSQLDTVDWEKLRKLKSLKKLKLNSNNLSGAFDLSLLPPNLETLDLRDNKISSVAVDGQNEHLQDLTFTHNHLKTFDFSRLKAACPVLKYLHLDNNQITQKIDFELLTMPQDIDLYTNL